MADAGLLIGYASAKLAKLCTQTKEARKRLPQRAADALPGVLLDLGSFENLGEIPFNATPHHFHPLTGDRAGEYAVRIDAKVRLVFRPDGDYDRDDDGTPRLGTVTAVVVTYVGDYHDGS